MLTKFDPFPFTFLLTCSNVLQLILIFILAVGARQSSAHAELRAEHDHDSISRLIYHQELQERILLEIAQKIEIDVESIKTMVAQLASGSNSSSLCSLAKMAGQTMASCDRVSPDSSTQAQTQGQKVATTNRAAR